MDGVQCPYLKQACIKERCQLYMSIPIIRPGQLVGSIKTGMVRGCAHVLATHLLAQLISILAASADSGPPSPS